MQEQPDWQPLPTDEPAGQWEYQEFSARLYGRVSFLPDCWPPERDLPNKQLIWHVDLAVRRLLAQIARSGWQAAEPADALSLWKAGRVDFTLAPIGVFSGKYEVALQRLRLICARWVPAGAESE